MKNTDSRARTAAANMPITLIDNDHEASCLSSGPTTIVREESVSPKAFIDLVEKDPGAIKRVRVYPGHLGSPTFGEIIVEYSVPRVKRLFQLRRKR
jgi:hypothetical protein